MPEIDHEPNPLTEPDAAWEAFFAEFQRSKRGNLWCRRETEDGTLTLTVFRRGAGYAWSIADGAGPRYSRQNWDDEETALGELWRELLGIY
jgi:hypothetical protein